MRKAGIIVFPGTNCEYDTYYAITGVAGYKAEMVWYKDVEFLDDYSFLVIPGGFSFGDYLRAGAIAALTETASRIADYAHNGGIVLGICNGFQILTEMNLLPGAFLKNRTCRFVSRWTFVRVEDVSSPFTNMFEKGELCYIPIAHFDGMYYKGSEDVRVAFRYCDGDGNVSLESNPDGTKDNIAGVLSTGGNILGIMPHPERAVEPILGGTDGLKIFLSIINFVENIR